MTDSTTWDGGLNPPDAAWVPTARQATSFTLDAGFQVPSHLPHWIEPQPGAPPPLIQPPSLPQSDGAVLGADAEPGLHELIRYFRQFPPVSAPARRAGLARFNSFAVNPTLCLPNEHPIVLDTFGPSVAAADPLLAHLANTAAPDGKVYDNLDQGWALRVLIRGPDILLLDWNWDASPLSDPPRAIRIARHDAAQQAALARQRMLTIHAALVDAIGIDLWQTPPPDPQPTQTGSKKPAPSPASGRGPG